MKSRMIILTMLCGIMMFAAEPVKFTTQPDVKQASAKALAVLRIMPENQNKNKFYRITMQIRLTRPEEMVTCISSKGKKNIWGRYGIAGAGWQHFCQYIAPGESSVFSLKPLTEGNRFFVRNIKVEELDESNLTTNLLPPLANAGWHSVWGKNRPKLGFENCDDSPYGKKVFTATINNETGYPATLSIPAISGRTVIIDIWVKGEPDEVWMATVATFGTRGFKVTKKWRKHQLKIKLKSKKAPTVSDIVFWKYKNQKRLKCTFGQIKVRYAK